MKLLKQDKIIGHLAKELKQNEIGELVATSPSFSQKEKEECQTPIKFLVALKKKCDEAEFIAELERLFGVCNFTHLLKTIKSHGSGDFEVSCPNPQGQAPSPNQDRSECFRSTLMKMSHSITEKDLEIMVALAPIPEGSKEGIQFGYELFEELERRGCIGENDIELLQEMFELLHLAKAKQLLLEYTTSAHAPIEPPPSQAPFAQATKATDDCPSTAGGGLLSSLWRPLSIFSSAVSSLLPSRSTSTQSEGRKRDREGTLDDAASIPPVKVLRSGGNENVESQAQQVFINCHITCLLSPAPDTLNHQCQIQGRDAAAQPL